MPLLVLYKPTLATLGKSFSIGCTWRGNRATCTCACMFMHIHICICVYAGCWIKNSTKIIFFSIAHLSFCKSEVGYTTFSPKMPYGIPSTTQGLKQSLWPLTVLSQGLLGKEPENFGSRGKFLPWGSGRGRRLSSFSTFLPWLF